MLEPKWALGVSTCSDAVMSKYGTYRYELMRAWNPDACAVCFIMLNPSPETWNRCHF